MEKNKNELMENNWRKRKWVHSGYEADNDSSSCDSDDGGPSMSHEESISKAKVKKESDEMGCCSRAMTNNISTANLSPSSLVSPSSEMETTRKIGKENASPFDEDSFPSMNAKRSERLKIIEDTEGFEDMTDQKPKIKEEIEDEKMEIAGKKNSSSTGMRFIGRGSASRMQKRVVQDAGKQQYNLLLPPKDLVDPEIDHEMITRLNLTVEELKKHAVELFKNDPSIEKRWPEQFILGSTNEENTRVLVLYKHFPRATIVEVEKGYWRKKNLDGVWMDYAERLKMLNTIREKVKEENGDLFECRYPNVLAEEEGDAEYVEAKYNIYLGVLRGQEWRMTFDSDLNHQPPVYVINWTGHFSRKRFTEFKYCDRLLPSPKVLKALKNSSNLKRYRCSKGDCGEKKGCSSIRSTCECALKRLTENDVHLECWENCQCDVETCGNRVVQRGRQVALAIFYHHQKGFTVRTPTAIRKGDFVAEYCGEVLTEYEACRRRSSTYTMLMQNPRITQKKGEKRKEYTRLVIDATEYGNVTRFVSHSCHPNMELRQVVVERAGTWFCRMYFVASEDIEKGAEITFDYFPQVTKKGKHLDFRRMIANCCCGSDACKFLPIDEDDKKEAEEIRRKYEKEMNATKDDWSDVDENEGKDEGRNGSSDSDEEEEEIDEKEITKKPEEMSDEDEELDEKEIKNDSEEISDEEENVGEVNDEVDEDSELDG